MLFTAKSSMKSGKTDRNQRITGNLRNEFYCKREKVSLETQINHSNFVEIKIKTL